MIVPPDVSKRMEEVRRDLKREVIKIAMEYGIPHKLIDDSQAINEAIEDITFKINQLHITLKWHGTNTNFYGMDGVYFKPIKKCEFNNDLVKTIREFKKMDKLEKEGKIIEEPIKKRKRRK